MKRTFTTCLMLLASFVLTKSQTWTAQTTNSIDNLSSISMYDAQNGWAFGQFGGILHTSDGGQNWISQGFSSNTSFNDSHVFNDSTVIGLGEHNLFEGFWVKTANTGQTWSGDSTSFLERINGAHFINNTEGWGVGRDGFIVHSTNGGQSWSLQTSSTPERLFDVYFADAMHGWAVGKNGAMIRTTTGGSTWTNSSSGVGDDLEGIFFINSTKGWAVGESGIILTSGNGGMSWTPQSSGTTADLFTIQFVNDTVGWAGGALGTLLYTSNGGQTWTPQASAATNDIFSLSMLSSSLGWLCAAGGQISKYEDNSAVVASFTTAAAVCQGEVNVFTDQSTGNPNSWSWDFGDGSGTSNMQNPSYTFGSAGTYIVQLVAGNATGTTDTFTQSVLVHPPAPDAAFSVSDSTICTNDTLFFTDLSTNNPGTWIWDFGDGSTGTFAQNPSYVYPSPGTYTVSLTALSSLTCSDTASKTVTVTGPVMSILSNTTSICLYDTASISVTGASVYQWSPGTALSDSTSDMVQAFPSATTTYTITGTDTAGCQATTNLTIIVNTAVVSISPVNPVICSNNDSVLLTASGGLNYLWSPPGGLNQTTGDSVWASPSVPTNYLVIGQDANGCTDTAFTTVSLDSTSVPTANFNISDTLICGSGSVSFQNTSLLGQEYEWIFDGGSLSSSTMVNPVNTYSGPGTYGATLVVIGCAGNDTLTRSEIIVVEAEVTASFMTSADTLDLSQGNQIDMMDQSVNAAQWLWDFGNGDTSQQQNPTATFTAIGQYTITLIAGTENCQDTAQVVVTVIESTPIEDEISQKIRLYPNPATGYFTVESPFKGSEGWEFELFELSSGKRIFKTILTEERTIISTAELSRGFYIYRVSQGREGFVAGKLIVN